MQGEPEDGLEAQRLALSAHRTCLEAPDVESHLVSADENVSQDRSPILSLPSLNSSRLKVLATAAPTIPGPTNTWNTNITFMADALELVVSQE